MFVKLKRCVILSVAAFIGFQLSLVVILFSQDKLSDPSPTSRGHGFSTAPKLSLVESPNTASLTEYDPELLIMIHSRGDYEGVLRRHAIRSTWLSKGHPKRNYK